MKRATLKDVAARAGVSKATVSYIINNSKKTISAETRARVEQAIKELNFVPNLGAASLSSNSTRLIGIVIPQTEPGSELMFSNPFYSEVIGAIEYHARQRGYHIIISATDVNESYMKLVFERDLDGVIVIGMYPDDFYQQFKKIEIPVVLIDSYLEDRYFHNIRLDDEAGGYLAAKYLLDRGHRKLGLLSGLRQDNGVIEKRAQGYKKALSEYGLSFADSPIFEGNVDYETGRVLAKKIVEERIDVTGIVATADILAMGAIRGFAESGASVPDDFSVVGFDDLEMTRYLLPALSTVHQDIGKKGELAVELLTKSMEDATAKSEELLLPVTFVERESVKSL